MRRAANAEEFAEGLSVGIGPFGCGSEEPFECATEDVKV